jgi:hypothetical protein
MRDQAGVFGLVCRRSAVDLRTVDLKANPHLSEFDFPTSDPLPG